MHAPSALRVANLAAILAATLLAATVPAEAGPQARGSLGGWRGVPPVSGVVRERRFRFAPYRRAATRALRRRGVRLRAFGFGGRFAGYGRAGGYGAAAGGFGYRYGGGGLYVEPARYGTTATQLVYGPGPGGSYLSERPLAVRFVEPPLAPSPYAPYSPGDRYAYAASADVVPFRRAARIRYAPTPCTCGEIPGLLPYGIGTAY